MDWITDLTTLLRNQPWELAGRLFVAMLLGGVVGFEREIKHHDAGLRTNILVSMGSCLFTILSLIGFGGNNPDTARIAAQIVSGIGFLGAGAVFRDQNRVRGLTTAAAVWLVAAIGMAAGTGSYFVAVITTLLALFVLSLLQAITERREPKHAARKTPPEEE